MKKAMTVQIENVGTVYFEKSRRARRLNITIRPYQPVRVAVPYGVSFEEARNFVNTRISWLQKHTARMKRLEMQWTKLRENSKPMDRESAKRKLVSRLAELARKHGFTYSKVFIKNQRTRWGSCSSQNNINLNVNLVHLPDELMDYVLLHELVHTKIKNHSRAFWRELDRFVGDARAKDKQLRQYGVGLF